MDWVVAEVAGRLYWCGRTVPEGAAVAPEAPVLAGAPLPPQALPA